MQKELSVALSFYNSTTLVGSPGTVKSLIGIVEFLGSRPLYTTQMYAIYKYCRVTAVTLQATFVNTGAVPVNMCIAVMPYSAASTATNVQMIEKPGSIRKFISQTGGLDRASIQRTASAQDWFGNPYFTKDYWIDNTQSSSSTPLDVNEPIFVLGVSDLAGAGLVTGQLTWKITFQCQFFDLQLPALS